MRLAGFVLVVLGVLAVIYGGFSYTSNDTKAEVGPIKIKVEEKERVNIPLWAGIGAIVVGGVLVVTSRKSLLA